MTTHANILRMLHRWRGGEFVPYYSDRKIHRLEYCKLTDGSMAFCWLDGGSTLYGREHDAHAHIELAGLKLCMKKFQSITQIGDLYHLMGDYGPDSIWYDTLSAAIEAALEKITGAKQ